MGATEISTAVARRGDASDDLPPRRAGSGGRGHLLAKRLRGTLRRVVGATSVGDGATSTGAFHEGLNAAAVEKLPLVVVVANNQFAYSTPNHRQFACADLVERAKGYGVGGHEVDGTDLRGVRGGDRRCCEAAREGGGPQMVVARLLRLTGHGEHDDASYVPDSVRAGLGRDCIEVAASRCGRRRAATEESFRLAGGGCRRSAEVVAQAQQEPAPDPWQARTGRPFRSTFQPAGTERNLRRCDPGGAGNAAARRCTGVPLRSGHRRVRRCVQGDQGTGRGFPGRVLDSPISEDAMIGMAVGAAIDGMRPIVEMQFADFSSIAFNQLVNQAGRTSTGPACRCR